MKRPLENETVLIDWRPVFSTKTGHNWMEAVVVDTLDTQFTAIVQVDGEPLTYRFYADHGDSWKFCG